MATQRFPLDDRYDLWLGDDLGWTDVTGYVYDRDAVTITRGRSAEAETADPSSLTLTLDNRDGRFSPRNPTGPYYGLLGRNTPIRVSLPYGSSYLRIPEADDDSHASCPDAAALGITGDVDVSVEVDAEHWQDGGLVGKYETTDNQRSWMLLVNSRKPQLFWSPDGTLDSRLSATATEDLPVARGNLAVRATLDVDNGAGGWTVTFYTADTLDGSWTQLGDPVTETGTTSVFDSTAPLIVGAATDFADYTGIPGRYLRVELRNGIDGTVVADPDFSAQTAGAADFTDTAGHTWTVNGDASIEDRQYRFYGEVASWPATWAVGGVDRYVKITAHGIKRRLTQNAPNLRSSMYRAHASPEQTGIVAYWPLEDGKEATRLASGIPSHPPMTITGSPNLAAYSDWTASDPLPEINNARFSGAAPPYTATGETMIYFFLFVDTNVSSETSLLKVVTTGTARTWEIFLLPNGNLRTRAYDDDGDEIDDGTGSLGSEVAFELDSDGFLILKLELVQDGSDVDWAVVENNFNNTDTIGDIINTTEISGTISGYTVGRVVSVTIGDGRGLGSAKVAHVVVSTDIDKWLTGVAASVAAWNGEDPIDRMQRLCDEEGIQFTAVTKGATGNTVTLGDQLNKPLVDLLEEAADADGGILYEPRDFLGFAYRTRQSMYNQDAAVTLDYSGQQITGDLTPVDDDQTTVNDLTVKREAGSSVHVEQTTGPLSTAEPPDGVGRYSGEVTLSLEDDAQLADQAGWRLHLGTVDEARFPTLTVNLRSTGIDDEVYEKLLDLDVGDRIVVTGIPEGLPPDDVSLLVQGYTETLRLYQHQITFNLAPGSPWHIQQADTDGYDRIESGGSQLASGIDADDTTLSVATTDGTVWTTDSDDTPFTIRVGGEVMTVTSVAGSTSPQTFTVVRGVNGIVKTHNSGTEIHIAEPTFIAL